MIRTATIPNVIDVSITRSCGGTSGAGGGANISSGGRGGSTDSGMVGRGTIGISGTIAWIASIFTAWNVALEFCSIQ